MEPVSLFTGESGGEGAEKHRMLVLALYNCLDGLDLGTQQALSHPQQCCLHSSFKHLHLKALLAALRVVLSECSLLLVLICPHSFSFYNGIYTIQAKF